MSVETGRVFRARYPWYDCWRNANRRCNDVNHKSYKYSGAKGIKFYLSREDAAHLWERDKAYLMERPSIDRIDATKHYTFDNCRFMEFLENIMRPHLEREEVTEWID